MGTALCWEWQWASGHGALPCPQPHAPLGISFIWFLSWIFTIKLLSQSTGLLSSVSFSQISNTRGPIQTPAFAAGWVSMVLQDPAHIHLASAGGRSCGTGPNQLVCPNCSGESKDFSLNLWGLSLLGMLLGNLMEMT